VLGALASGMLLYGATLVYGFTGTTSFDKLAGAACRGRRSGLLIGMVLVASRPDLQDLGGAVPYVDARRL
jgi:NADH-quinone oxidoreductase subunit N